MLYKKIKADSHLALTTSWSRSIAVTIIAMGGVVFFILTSFLSLYLPYTLNSKTSLENSNLLYLLIPITIIVSYSLLSPTFMGIKKHYQGIISGNQPAIKDIFYYGRNLPLFLKIIYLYLNVFLKKVLIYLLCFFPALGYVIYSFLNNPRYFAVDKSLLSSLQNYQDPKKILLFFVIFSFLLLPGFFLARLFSSRYYVISYVFLRNPHLSVKKILKLSAVVTKNEKITIFLFRLSGSPSKALSLLFLPILYLYPQTLMSSGIFCNYLIDKYRFSGGKGGF